MTDTTTETTQENPFRTDYHDSETDVHHFLNTHLPCPYTTEVEKKAWCEGYTKAMIDATGERGYLDATGERGNPYTSGDTTVAWHQGYEDYAYRPAPFNPTDIPANADVSVRLNVTAGDTWERRARLLWKDNAWSGSDRRQPWADNREEDRCIWLPWTEAQWIIKSGLFNTTILPDASVELPCPPYTYEYEGGGMSISAGKFTKWGSKESWETVVAEMQEKVEEMPDGINIEDGTVELDVTMTYSFSVSVPMSIVVDNEDGMFMGDVDQLSDAITDGVQYGDFSDHFEDSVDLRHADWSVEPRDVDYDIRSL